MPIADQKKIQSFIQRIMEQITKLESLDSVLQAAKSKWLSHNPDVNVAGANLTAQDVTDANAFINAVNAVLSDHAAIITTLKAKNMPSHGTESLD